MQTATEQTLHATGQVFADDLWTDNRESSAADTIDSLTGGS